MDRVVPGAAFHFGNSFSPGDPPRKCRLMPGCVQSRSIKSFDMKSKLAALLATTAVVLSGVFAVAADNSAPRTIKIRAGVDNAMKYDVVNLSAGPGETLKVVLTNASVLPKEVMGHNWVLLKAGTDPIAFAAAAVSEAANGYIPARMKDKIVAVIGLLGPNETGEIMFKAPDAPGEYPFVCTFPGHGQIGMKGVLMVKK
jgi:azurin